MIQLDLTNRAAVKCLKWPFRGRRRGGSTKRQFYEFYANKSNHLNYKTTSHNDEKITLRKVFRGTVMESLQKLFSEKHNVWLHQAIAILTLRQSITENFLPHPLLTVLLTESIRLEKNQSLLHMKRSKQRSWAQRLGNSNR